MSRSKFNLSTGRHPQSLGYATMPCYIGYNKSMKIESYSFGKMVIDGKVYTSDLIIYPERLNPSWWRKEGHGLSLEDLEDIIKERPDVLIIGTGYHGVMKVPERTIEFLKSSGIEVIVERTEKAVEIYNKMESERSKKIVGAFHLTC